MTRYLVATRSVHTTAAACDYLLAELSPDDEVLVVTVDEEHGDDASDPESASTPGPDATDRDGGDALNVATARLSGAATVERERRAGDPAEAVLSAADEAGADRIVLGAHGGEPGTEQRLGSTAERVLASAGVPVVVVPVAL